MTLIIIVIILGIIDITGRMITLSHMLKNTQVRTLNYKTWMWLVALLNFAFIAYWLFAHKKSKGETDLK